MGDLVLVWRSANARQTLYMLSAADMLGTTAAQERVEAILARFRLGNATSWHCPALAAQERQPGRWARPLTPV